MSDTAHDDRAPHISAQVTASVLSERRVTREAVRDEMLSETIAACNQAKHEFQRIRDFVFDPNTPGPRGSQGTQHGEIAERLTVADINAANILDGEKPTATYDVPRQGAIDLIVDGVPIQSKYGKSPYLSLREIVHHIKDNGPDNPRFFHIPPEQRAILDELRDSGTIEGMAQGHIDAICRQLEEIKVLSGRDPQAFIASGTATRDEVKREQIGDSLDQRERKIDSRSDEQSERILADHAPSASGLAQATGIAGVAGAGVAVTQAIIRKCRQGKNPFKGEFTIADWTEIGVSGGKGSAAGMVSGNMLYLLTNATDLAAPFAGSLVSTMIGINDLRRSYRAGSIDQDQFVDLCHVVASEAAIVGIAVVAGQAMIPVPILGAVVGSVAGKIVAASLKGRLETDAAELVARLKDYERWAMAQLDEEFCKLMARINEHFTEFERLTEFAFDPDTNTKLRLRTSAALARAVNVPDEVVLDSTEEVDSFMTE